MSSWVDAIQFEWYLELSEISHRIEKFGILQFPVLIFDYFDK